MPEEIDLLERLAATPLAHPSPRLEAAASSFRAAGLPSRRQEAFKYTDLRPLARTTWRSPAPRGAGADSFIASAIADRLGTGALVVLVDGRFDPGLSRLAELEKGVLVEEAGSVDPDGVAELASNVIASLAAIGARSGFRVEIAAGTTLERSIEILHVSTGGDEPVAAHRRGVITLRRNARATVIERFVGPDGAGYLATGLTEIEVGDRARLTHLRLQDEGREATHLAHVAIRVGRDAAYDTFTLTMGAALSRHEIRASFAAPGGDIRLTGVYLVDGTRHADTTTLIDHAVPDCRSREVYHGVLDGTARGVFQGKILVRPDAQRTDGHQLNRALLLSRGAEIDAKPELEIYADDVKCSHGSTVGELDPLQLFYLRSRGISEAQGRALLIDAFVATALDEIGDEALREAFSSRVTERLHPDGASQEIG